MKMIQPVSRFLSLSSLPYLLLSAIMLLFSIPILTNAFYLSHDAEAHIARFGAYIKAFADFHLPPRWAGDLNYTYGIPVLNFYYPFSGYIASLLYFFGLQLQTIYKIIILTGFIVCPVFFYVWISKKVNYLSAITASLIYGLAPYHFLDLYVRGDVAELLALALLPLIFYYLDRFVETEKNKLLGIIGLLYGLLILSHNVLSLMFTPVILLYILAMKAASKSKTYLMCSLLLGLGLSFYFWFPAISEQKYTHSDLFIGNMYQDHFPTLSQLYSSNWGFGANVTDSNGLSPSIGRIQLILSLLSILILVLRKKISSKTSIIFWLFIFITGIFFSLKSSAFLWQIIPLLPKFQFPWRFTALTSFSAAILSAYALNNIRNYIFIILVVLGLLIQSLPLTRIQPDIFKPDEYYFSYLGTTDFHNAASTIWSAGNPGKKPQSQFELIEGVTEIKLISKKTNKHLLAVDAKVPSRIVDNTLYYPGWHTLINGQEVPIQFQDPNYRGLITFFVPQGQSQVRVEFRETKLRKSSNGISLVALLLIFIIIINKIQLNKIISKRSASTRGQSEASKAGETEKYKERAINNTRSKI